MLLFKLTQNSYNEPMYISKNIIGLLNHPNTSFSYVQRVATTRMRDNRRLCNTRIRKLSNIRHANSNSWFQLQTDREKCQ